jgi:hypothetical protein
VIVSVVAHKEETVVPETTSAPPEIITEKEGAVKETEQPEKGKTENPPPSSNDSEKTKGEKKQ